MEVFMNNLSNSVKNQNSQLFQENVDKSSWLVDNELKPEVMCIYGPYINQRVLRSAFGQQDQDKILLHVPTTHHDAHWHHGGGRSGSITDDEFKRAMNVDNGQNENCIFALKEKVKIREEKEGCLISDKNTAYYVNSTGYKLMKSFKSSVSFNEIKKQAHINEVPEKDTVDFFKRLLMFGIYIGS